MKTFWNKRTTFEKVLFIIGLVLVATIIVVALYPYVR